MAGKWLGTRPIRCNWATKTNNSGQADENNNSGHGMGMNGNDQIGGLQSPNGQGSFQLPSKCIFMTTVLLVHVFYVNVSLCILIADSLLTKVNISPRAD